MLTAYVSLKPKEVSMRLVLLDVRPSRVKEKKKIFLGKGLRVYKEIATDRK